MDQALAILVGQRIRRLRQQRGLGLRRQAELAGVSPSALSALENGRGGMSLSALTRLATHLGLTTSELLASPTVDGGPDADAIEVFEDCASTLPSVQRRGGVLYQVIGSGKGHQLQPLLLSFLPGATYSAEPFSHPGEEFFYVIVGEIDFQLGDETHRLKQGDAIRFRSEIPHTMRNTSTTGIAVVIGAATPPW